MRKEFNLKDYESGKFNVVTRVGHPVIILKTGIKSRFSIAGIETIDSESECICSWTFDGHLNPLVNSDRDLFLVSKPHKLHLVHYLDKDNDCSLDFRYHVLAWEDEELAKRFAMQCPENGRKYLKSEVVEVEEED